MFFSIPNVRSTAVTVIDEDPTTLPPPDYASFKGNKIKYRQWCGKLSTNHRFLSLCEGVTNALRVSSDDNPLYRVHGLLIDYDAQPPPGVLEHLEKNRPAEFMPSYFVSTFSGNARLVWEFETPFYPAGIKHYKEFIKHVSKTLQLVSWLPGYEAGSLGDPSHHYEQGVWTRLSGGKIPKAHVELWALESMKRLVATQGLTEAAYDIPLERVALEVEARYPGKWRGSFELGSRGCAFWSADGLAHNACVVFEDGMYCFSESIGAGFYPWVRILGQAFVDQFEADKMQEILKEPIFYDGEKYWRRSGEDTWDALGKPDFSQELRTKGFNSKIQKGETSSEIDRIEVGIKGANRVSGVMPFLFYPEGKIYYEGERYLNTSRAVPMQPAPPFSAPLATLAEGRTKFPFLYKLLTTMFYAPIEEADNPKLQGLGEEQLDHFLAWLKYFYMQSLEQHPRPGHAIVLAGPAGKGKTFLFKHILSKLMGGVLTGTSDGSGHLVGGETWTDRLIRTPLILIDDDLMAADPRDVTRFTSRVKKYVSSPSMIYNQKYKLQCEVPWFGRIVILCNTDAESLRILPNMSISVRDKISLFKASVTNMHFETWEKNAKLVRNELPNLARFLVDWEIPDRCVPKNDRFGVAVYHHPELLDESLQSGLDGTVLELLVTMMKENVNHDKAKPEQAWIGSYVMLYNQLATLYDQIMRDIKPRALAVCLGNLSSNGYDVTQHREGKSRERLWRIGPDLLRARRNEKTEGETE